MKKTICKTCGKEFFQKHNLLYCSKKCKKRASEERIKENLTLCWSCGNACGGCEWSAFFIPVKGWRADETVIKNLCVGREYTSYHIYECPKFVPDK